MRCHSLGDPAGGVALRVCDQAVVGGVCHDRLERRSDHRCFTAIGKHFLVTRVANGDPVVCIVKRESFGYRLDCFGERLLHGAPIVRHRRDVRLVPKADILHCAVRASLRLG